MADLAALLRLAHAYADAHRVPLSVASKRALNDSVRLGALARGEADIGLKRLRKSLLWFSENWPEDASWPDGIERFVRTEEDDRADQQRRPRAPRTVRAMAA